MLAEGHKVIKLIDFGLSRFFYPGETVVQASGTLAYSPPEVIVAKPHDKRMDVWSLGVMLYAMFELKMPFMNIDKSETAKNIIFEEVIFSMDVWRS